MKYGIYRSDCCLLERVTGDYSSWVSTNFRSAAMTFDTFEEATKFLLLNRRSILDVWYAFDFMIVPVGCHVSISPLPEN